MEPDLWGYHSTPRTNEAAVDVEGLLPRWQWGEDRQGNRVWYQEPVHISVDGALSDFISDLFGAYGECVEVVTYKVDLDGLTLHPGIDGPGTVAIFEWIKPERLTKDGYHKGNRPE